MKRFPADPWFAWVYAHERQTNESAGSGAMGLTDAELARRFAIPRSSLIRAREGGFDAFTADRLAIRAGLHPLLLWPDWLEDSAA